jgi:outer membrane protein OmpA-like peptidoglycan-associated protein
MLKQNLKLSVIAAALVAAGAAHASDYVTAGGAPLRTSSGECVHTGGWTARSPECDAKPVRVFFGFDQAEVDEGGRRALDALAQKLRDAGADRIIAIGHADAVGTDGYNLRLSELRVKAVRDYLVEKGVPMRAFTIEAKGKRDPETMGACERTMDRKDGAKLIACLAPDRRVEIEVMAANAGVQATN